MLIYSRPPYPSDMYDQNSAYPYLLINAFDETTLDYVNHKSTRFIKSVIVDAGVHSVFHRHELQEYPGGYQHWIARVARLWRIVSRLVADSYVVIPDYPADYENNEIADNVERTFRNIDYAVKKYPDVRWIIPIQGKKDDVVSVVKSFEYIRDSGLLERYNYIAIAPTCTTNNLKFLRDVAQIIWKRVKQVEGEGRRIKIHMFGVTMKAWRSIAPFVDSTDTIVINYMCRLMTGTMCTRKTEKETAWRMFVEKVSQMAAIKRL